MVGAQSQQVFELLPRLIQRLILSLSEGCDLVPQACHLTRWKELGEEGFCELIPRRDGP